MKKFYTHILENERKEEDRVKDKHKKERIGLTQRQDQEIFRARQVDLRKKEAKKQLDTPSQPKKANESYENPPEVGTDEIVSRYKSITPGE